jgi:predicted DCC family thiol-disulfide oxidoreductase YuxK
MKKSEAPIIFFDGVCNLCNGFIDFLVRNDRGRKYRYASLQGETAKARLSPEQIERLDSVVLWEDGKTHERSDAVLRILAGLGGGWKLARFLSFAPRSLRDGLYDKTAENRYKVFGRRHLCRVPSPEERALFLD